MLADIIDGNVPLKVLKGSMAIPLDPDDRIYLTLAQTNQTNDGHIQLRTGMYSRLEIEEI